METQYDHHILIVDDEASILKSLNRLFRKKGYQIHTASSGTEALAVLNSIEAAMSLILSDQRMPGMNGAAFLEKAKVICPDAIRILLTGYSDMDAIVDAVNKGEIHRYLTKPWIDDDLLLQVKQGLDQYELVQENKRLQEKIGKQNRQLYEIGVTQKKIIQKRTRELEQKNRKLESSLIETFHLLNTFVANIHPRLGMYLNQVAKIARDVAADYGLPRNEIDQVEIAGIVHDIGFLGSPEGLIIKDEKEMFSAELEKFRQHPAISQFSLQIIEELETAANIVLHHHEHYDGSGFPEGLRGDKIPLGARIIGAVSEYFRITNLWPDEMDQIFAKARTIYGSTALKEINAQNAQALRLEIAEKAVLLGCENKFDTDVVGRLLKLVSSLSVNEAKRRVETVNAFSLKEGMCISRNLCTVDGKLLLSKDTVLNKNTVKSICEMANNKLIENPIYVFGS